MKSFEELLEHVKGKEILDPREVDPIVFRDKNWEQISKKDLETVMLPFLRFQLARAIETMPEVYDSYPKNVIATMDDFYALPVLPKDTTVNGIKGLRQIAHENPYDLLPTDTPSASAYFSGGTKAGQFGAAPTWVTPWDIQVESQAFARLMEQGGIKPGSVVINTYNSSHKGGRAVVEALEKLGCLHIQSKSSDVAEDISGYIKRFARPDRDMVFIGVQPPIADGDTQNKGGGRTLFDVFKEDPVLFREYNNNVLLGGFRIIPQVENWADSMGIPTNTIYGATEVLPAFLGTAVGPEDRSCRYNTLHAAYGPHLIEVLKLEEGRMVPVEEGETGVLALTTVFREGTILLRYLIGDEATYASGWDSCSCERSTPLHKGIYRADVPEEIQNHGCASL